MEILTSLSAMAQPLRGVLFDMDGTTLDTMRRQHMFIKQCAQRYGDATGFPEYGAAFVEQYNRDYAAGSIRQLYTRWGIDWKVHEGTIWTDYGQFYRENVPDVMVVDGCSLADVIREMHVRGQPTLKRNTRLRIGADTTKSRENIFPALDRAGIRHCFDSFATYDDIVQYVGTSIGIQHDVSLDDIPALRKAIPKNVLHVLEKPNSHTVSFLLGRLGVPPGQVLAFEDTAVGVQSHKRLMLYDRFADLYVVGVTWGYEDRRSLVDAGADAIIDSPRDMLGLVELLGGFS